MMGARVVIADFRQVTGVTRGKTTADRNTKKRRSSIKLNKKCNLLKITIPS